MDFMSVKLRRVGTSNVLTVPFFIHTDCKEYNVFVGTDGAIIYIPTQTNDTELQRLARKHGAVLPYRF
ncbi:hypothetical protein FC21_GL000284 [Limosilactobacillus equigenerosi DSM 18793 = JCM 14505]|uniref:Uncharacterized protein n=2 Tax=Limosilactobacillus TaxID=2742598 RepID=A0A0R1USX8_9LACO|nr:hypothetical protein FC21_GL000284 [Limosilactobacillus equigenerosi DSM 18793 = JCM 14505]